MVCSPRTSDGRCHPAKVVYEVQGKRIEIPIGSIADARIPGAHLSKTFNAVEKRSLDQFPDQVHLSMTSEMIRVSDIRTGKEETRFEFTIDAQGLKIQKEYDELPIWMALYRGLNHDEIDLNHFYESLARNGYYTDKP